MEKILKGLNDKQKEAVTFTGNSLLVLAGAGSGKTKVLTHRAAFIVSQKLAEPQNLLLLTFTNKAASEMKQRIGNLLITHNLQASSQPFAGTFHSFCARLLRIDGQRIGIPRNFIIYDDNDQKDVVGQIIRELDLPKEYYNAGSISSQISEAKTMMLTPLEYAEVVTGRNQDKIFQIYDLYEKELKKAGALDFDDLLLRGVKLLDSDKEMLDKWQNKLTNIFVDEWQDTNKIQYKLTKLLVGDRKNLTAVGDASQSVYSWRGADYRNITYLMRDYPTIKVVNLEQNYRSTQTILDAANSVIKRNTSHPILSLWTNKMGGDKIRLYHARNELDEADFVVQQIDKLITQGYEFKNICLLYRTNAQSRVLEEALLHNSIPYVLVGGVRFYERKEVKDVLAYLRLFANPKDRVSRKRLEKLGARRLEKFEALANELQAGSKKDKKILDQLTTLEILDAILQKVDYLSKYKIESEENLARLENIKELRSVAMEFPNLYEFLENVALIEAEQLDTGKIRRRTAEQENKNAVTLMTLHAAKGLEFNVVFIVGMEEGLFPHSRSLFDLTQLEEERRLCYVGITRTKDILYLTYAGKRLFFGQKSSNPPSRFIIDIPEELLTDVGDRLGHNLQSDNNFSFDDIDKIDNDDDLNF
ncbi:MAG: ATP-dependent DNA helicase PcrA [Candidatus Woesebacteria bacterium GW2011_GWA1_39_21]|uniref:DNA 3'-5' helicase n=1 Tax=Candidatus Woesebacteria bacterium GW2011_GWA1_39_21 TaxID=1618550 RepID=A0A0G0NFX5_9BACT|nr:MAG: ATP-dependent DNA helicase PcrA [Candidatus Woesebacteria bacterium GW2011_GWA1_39_21]